MQPTQPMQPMQDGQRAREAFLLHIKQSLPRLWRFAIVLTRDQATADDLVQAACVRAVERGVPFVSGVDLDRRVMTIMRSIWSNDHRAESIRERDAILLGLRMVRREGGEKDKLFARLFAAIETLPEWKRLAILLVGVESYSLRDAASVLGIPEGTLTSRLARSRVVLRCAAR